VRRLLANGQGAIGVTLVALLMSLSVPGRALGAPPPRVEYVVDLSEARSQMVGVEMILRDVDERTIEVRFPAWRPGKYVILDLAGALRDVRATTARGAPLDIRKISKASWRIDTRGADEVRVSYRFYANEIRDRTRHADDTHAFLSGSGTFMYWPKRREEPLRVRVEAPEHWRIATGLEPDPELERAVVAPSYDVLVDSPLEIGEQHVIEFRVAGKPHEIVIWGRGNWDDQTLAEDFAAIIEEQREIFGELPYRRYVFLIHSNPGMGGGTEHLNSTIMGARPDSFEGDRYERWLGLVSHEFFHTWNVKRLRPAGIHPYDYQRENYTDLLWVAEGTTSYYDDLTLARAELIDVDEYLDRIGGAINGYRRLPGRTKQSLSESSFDAWIKFWKRNEDHHNYNVSFYRKGSLVSLLIDIELRQRTAGDVSLDDVMRAMYERYPLSGPGYTTADLLATLQDLSGTSFASFFAAYVDGVEPLPLEAALERVGLRLARDADDEEEHEAGEGKDEQSDAMEAYLGLSLTDDEGFARVRRLNADGPARAAGLIVDDRIVAMDGIRLEADELGDRLEKMEPGETVTFSFLRWDELREIEVTLAGRPAGKWTVTKVEDPTPEQRAAFEAWIQQPWDEPEDEALDRDNDEGAAERSE